MCDDNKYNNVEERNSLKFQPIKIIDNLLMYYRENDYLLTVMQLMYTYYNLSLTLNILTLKILFKYMNKGIGFGNPRAESNRLLIVRERDTKRMVIPWRIVEEMESTYKTIRESRRQESHLRFPLFKEKTALSSLLHKEKETKQKITRAIAQLDWQKRMVRMKCARISTVESNRCAVINRWFKRKIVH